MLCRPRRRGASEREAPNSPGWVQPGDGSWDQIDALPITFGEHRGAWNYTIAPLPARPPEPGTSKPRRPGQPGRPQPSQVVRFGDEPACAAWVGLLTCPDVTGIPQADWDRLVGVLEPAYRQLREQQALQARGGQPGAYPDRRSRGLKVDIAALMLAAFLHRRHQLPVMQVSRLIDLHHISVRQHIANLLLLFAQNGFTLDPIGKIRKLEQLCDAVAIPQQVHPTREVTT